MKKAAVIGAGTMGHGIAQTLALAGIDVALVDINAAILDKAMDDIKQNLGRFAERHKIGEEAARTALLRIKLTTNVENAVKDSDFIIEAVAEDLTLKKRIFKNLGEVSPKNTILATNTSSLSITEISKVSGRPDKVVGMHFFNPPTIMMLVEVIKGECTSDETVNLACDLVKKLDKTPVVVRKDVRAFIVNRILFSMLNEACRTVSRDEATVAEMDAAFKYKEKFPMGAFELLDYIGLDIVFNVLKVMETTYGARFKTCSILEQIVKEKKFGKKTGEGFYDWKDGRPVISSQLAEKFSVLGVYAVAVNEAAWLIYEGVTETNDIDTAMKLGAAWPLGPCELADRLGLDAILSQLKELFSKHGEEFHMICPLLEEYVKEGRKFR
ncbi:MAG: 3-hydroxyacyl-CoA dehydrogenase [Candidatus Bathyarchaeota archaeon]